MSGHLHDAPPTALAVCPSSVHPHGRALLDVDRWHVSARQAPSGRTRSEHDAAWAELGARWRSCGPFAGGGLPHASMPADEFAARAFGGLSTTRSPYAETKRTATSLGAALRRAGIPDVGTLDCFRRMAAVRGALAAVQWAAAPPSGTGAAHDVLLAELDEPAANLARTPDRRPGPGARPSRDGLVAAVDAVERRRCAAGPLVVRDDGVLDRLASHEGFGAALAGLRTSLATGRTTGDRDALDDALAGMDIASADALRSFRRLAAVHGALAPVRWAAAPPSYAPLAFDLLLREANDPARRW